MDTQNMPSIQLTPKVVELQKMAAQLIEKAEECRIENDEQEEMAVSLAKMLSDRRKDADQQRLELARPFNAAVRNLNDTINGNIINPLKEAERRVRTALTDYMSRKEAAARERQRQLEEQAMREAEERRKKLEDDTLKRAEELEAEGKSEEAEKLLEAGSEVGESFQAPVVPPPAKTPVRGTVGGSGSLRTEWAYKLDPAMPPNEAIKLVPDAYLVPPEDRLKGKVIKAAISGKDGLREIPGLLIYEKKTLALR